MLKTFWRYFLKGLGIPSVFFCRHTQSAISGQRNSPWFCLVKILTIILYFMRSKEKSRYCSRIVHMSNTLSKYFLLVHLTSLRLNLHSVWHPSIFKNLCFCDKILKFCNFLLFFFEVFAIYVASLKPIISTSNCSKIIIVMLVIVYTLFWFKKKKLTP